MPTDLEQWCEGRGLDVSFLPCWTATMFGLRDVLFDVLSSSLGRRDAIADRRAIAR
jgi:hypothetical protein